MITRVLITFGQRPTADYPLEVRIYRDTDKFTGDPQGHMVRSIQDGMLFGNGVCAGGEYGGAVNPEIDPRLKLKEV